MSRCRKGGCGYHDVTRARERETEHETENNHNKRIYGVIARRTNAHTHSLSQTAVDEGEIQPFADVRQVWRGCMQVTEARNADVPPMHTKRMPGGRKMGGGGSGRKSLRMNGC